MGEKREKGVPTDRASYATAAVINRLERAQTGRVFPLWQICPHKMATTRASVFT